MKDLIKNLLLKRDLQKEITWWILICGGLWFGSQYVDDIIWKVLVDTRTIDRNTFSIILTEYVFWVIFGWFFILAGRSVAKKSKHYNFIPASFSLFFTAIVSMVLKAYFKLPRPFEVFAIRPIVDSTFGAGFPSGHTAIAWALVVPLWRLRRAWGVIATLFALTISAGRIYQGVHFPSDIVGGIFVGGVVGTVVSHKYIAGLLKRLWKKLEFRRQLFHFSLGFLCVFAHWIGFLSTGLLLVGLFAFVVISYIAQKKYIPILSELLQLFERHSERHFPGKGAFYFLLGVFLSFLLFPVKIAYASILILSVGDSLIHVFNTRTHPRFKLPWNERKNFLGLAMGLVFGTFAAQFFVGLIPAFVACFFALLIESTHWNIRGHYVDDNITVPMTAGILLSLFV